MRTQTRSQSNLCNIPRRVKIYNVEKKELVGTFETILEAYNFSGIDVGTIRRALKHKYRCHKNKLGFTICFR